MAFHKWVPAAKKHKNKLRRISKITATVTSRLTRPDCWFFFVFVFVFPDCEYESPFELFRYLYTVEVNLSESNVIAALGK